MPHELATTADGRTAMMYCGEPPWHGLGTRLDAPATAEEAINAAGLNYEVRLTPLATADGLDVPQRKAVVRYDTQEVLGVVGNDYVPVQNREAFGFLDAVVAGGGLRYHTAGGLGRGERVWMLAKLPEQIRVKNSDDLVDQFLLLSNAHNGTAALRTFFTPIRVVCANTLAVAHRRGEGQGISIRHEGNLTAKIKEAQQLLGLAKIFMTTPRRRSTSSPRTTRPRSSSSGSSRRFTRTRKMAGTTLAPRRLARSCTGCLSREWGTTCPPFGGPAGRP
jgi:phage/plasmid-like protein (TIGR03299 family)